jgi:hypothetical protein
MGSLNDAEDSMEPDMDLARQVRKAVNDIRATIRLLSATEYSGDAATVAHKATYQLDCLTEMLDLPPRRRQPWSYFQPRVVEEFGE